MIQMRGQFEESSLSPFLSSKTVLNSEKGSGRSAMRCGTTEQHRKSQKDSRQEHQIDAHEKASVHSGFSVNRRNKYNGGFRDCEET